MSDLDQSSATGFVTEFDGVPGFWNYLVGLERNDLIAELVQNDLDQGATRTVVSFESSRLVCEGNGKPVDAEGWQRLRKILGAGDEVPAKRSRFGVKNHGLKTAFTIGDEIRLMSDGKTIVQTLYAKGRDSSPHPGASGYPMEDPEAPADGCHVIVPYRDNELVPGKGEPIKLPAVGERELDALFQTACANVPEQFAGIVSPEVTPRYELVLRHWRLGEARFSFSCTRPIKCKRAKRIEVFKRRCTVEGTHIPLQGALLEQAVRRLAPLKGVLKERVADYFRRGQRFFVEVSWPISTKGKPRTGTGKFRYPIGYPLSSHEARTGHGAYFNAPFVSDKERHAPAWNEATFAELREQCESLLIDAVAYFMVPKWGPDGLNPVVPDSDADDGDEAVRPILARLVQKGAMPVLDQLEAVKLVAKGRRVNFRAAIRRRRYLKKERRYRLMMPVLTWAQNAVHPSLSLLCPGSEMQLDPRTHGEIIRLLADGGTCGSGETFATFDEKDVFHRVVDGGNEYSDAVAKPFIAQAYLDLIKLALDENKLDTENEDELVAALLLPDEQGRATAFRDLYANASLPSDIPGLCLPPILNSGLSGHALFRRKKWKLRKFTITEFLKSDTLQNADEQTRKKFWNWLRRNERRIRPNDRRRLAGLIIWPDSDERLCKISDLCDPRSAPVVASLDGFIQRPHGQVRRSKLVSVGGKARTSIRRAPTEHEISAWVNTRLVQFEIGSQPDAVTIGELRRFEADLVTLLQDRSIIPLLKSAIAMLPALARDKSIQSRTELVMPSPGNDRLALPSRFLLNDPKRGALLNKLAPAIKAPTLTMLLDTFAEDPCNIDVLQPRLKKVLDISEPESDERCKLAGMSIIPVGDQWRAPSALAFAGNKGNYWGDWKIRIPTEGLSPDDQTRYREAGVTSASPNLETSREFFKWLADQDQDVLGRHIPCVLRHILHRQGPTDWAPIYTATPFIPVRYQNGLQLVSLQRALHKPVYLSDAGDIGDAVIQKDASVLLVIDQVKEVNKPISEPLRELGVRSLRNALGEPISATGTGEVTAINEDIRSRFDTLRTLQFRRTFRKRLNKLEIDSELLRHDWQDQLRRVQEFRCAEYIEVRHKFRNKYYRLDVDAGFDPGKGIFWMKRDLDTGGLYEAVAKQLVFKTAARTIDLYALELSLKLDIADPSFGRAAEFDEEESGKSGDSDDEKAGLGEAGGGHSPFVPDPGRNEPKPGPLTEGLTTEGWPTREHPRKPGPGRGGSPRQTPDLEKRHIEELKRLHYASHCQMCLCERSPQELAPVGSYIESEEVRRSIVEAHHTDLVAAGGERHAGNLLLLCKLHHDNYGGQLNRDAIRAALQDSPKRMSICFGKTSNVQGQQIELVISGTGEKVRFFFTDYHAQYWLSETAPY